MNDPISHQRPAVRLPLALLCLALACTTPSRAQQPDIAAESLPEAPRLAQPQPQSPAQDPAQTGIVHGTVVNQDNTVYEGVRVSLAPGSPLVAAPERTTVTDSSGRFTFLDVPPGNYRLIVSGDGFATQIIPATLQAGEVYDGPPIVLLVASASSEVRVDFSRRELATEQLHAEEQQRVLGFLPNFYVAYGPNVEPLTSRQKFHLAWRNTIDPFTIAITAGIAGAQQADNAFRGYGQGAQGYGKRFGADYADQAIGTFVGGAILPSLWHQDPRYFYKGTGTTRSRVLYAIAMSILCKGDNGRFQLNYSGIVGSLAAGGLSNLYYPASDRNGADEIFGNLALGTASSAISNMFQEFVVRKFTPHLPKLAHSNP